MPSLKESGKEGIAGATGSGNQDILKKALLGPLKMGHAASISREQKEIVGHFQGGHPPGTIPYSLRTEIRIGRGILTTIAMTRLLIAVNPRRVCLTEKGLVGHPHSGLSHGNHLRIMMSGE